MIIEYIPTYNYFSSFVNFTPTQSILDFGSNCGNLLKSGKINATQYTGVDVDVEAIDEGRKLFPSATWIWYNRQNPVYNATGDSSYPVLTQKFDIVVSYSVFSHIAVNDALDLLTFLYNKLSEHGKILFSYCDIDNRQCVDWFKNRRVDCDEITHDNYLYLVDNKVSDMVPTQCKHFVTFYDTQWLIDKLGKFNPVSYLPPNGWVQDCMILYK